MQILEDINSYSGVSMVCITFALCMVTLAYVILTRRIVEQARKQVMLILLSNKAAFHKEMCEKIYTTIYEWISSASNMRSLLNLGVKQYGLYNWNEFKKGLSYLVYQMDKRYLQRIDGINTMIDELMKKRFVEQIKSKFNEEIARIFLNKIDYKDDSRTLKKIQVKLYRIGSDATVTEDFLVFLCDRGLMQFFLDKIRESENVYWYMYAIDSTGLALLISDEELRRGGDGGKLTSQALSVILKEIDELIFSNNEYKSLIELVQKIQQEVVVLMKDLEVELGMQDNDLIKRYGIEA